MIKKIGISILQGIVWGLVIGSVMCMIMAALGNKYWFPMEAHTYLTSMLGAVLIGIGFTVPALVYTGEKLSMPFKVLIHMGAGYAVFMLTSYFLNWMPIENMAAMALYFMIAVATGVAIWFCFYLYHKKQAKKMTDRLRSMEQDGKTL